MKPASHIAISSALGAFIYMSLGSLPASASCLLGGVLIDIDHLVDYFVYAGAHFRVHEFVEACHEHRLKRLYLFFHSYELLGLLILITYLSGWNMVLLGLSVGTSAHLLCDQIVNGRKYKTRTYFYFLLFRISRGFRTESLVRE